MPRLKDSLRPVRRRLSVFKRKLTVARAHIAGTHECPVCGGRYQFEAFGDPPRPDAKCPGCGALERHRLLWLYLNREILPKRSSRCRLLHCAPEQCLSQRLAALSDVDYVSIDLSSQKATLRMDLTDLWFRDQIFDLVICSHVLEHIPDDRKAMREMLRVSKVGGVALLNVPDDPELAETYEDWSVDTPERRRLAFRQHDHVRIYSSTDYVKRLGESGWTATGVSYADRLSREELRRFALPLDNNQTIYHCVRG